ncbi:MAG: hypothetical protein ACPGWR_03250 [Ardenticatenaceae bacterium]
MIYELRVIYDDRDTLEAWLPEFDVEDQYETEPGPYRTFSSSRKKDAQASLDWLIIDSFSLVFKRAIAEVTQIEKFIPDRYNVPEFNLKGVYLSQVLEHVYQVLVPEHMKQASPFAVVTGKTFFLPPEFMRRAKVQENTRFLVTQVDQDTLLLKRAS